MKASGKLKVDWSNQQCVTASLKESRGFLSTIFFILNSGWSLPSPLLYGFSGEKLLAPDLSIRMKEPVLGSNLIPSGNNVRVWFLCILGGCWDPTQQGKFHYLGQLCWGAFHDPSDCTNLLLSAQAWLSIYHQDVDLFLCHQVVAFICLVNSSKWPIRSRENEVTLKKIYS